MCVKISVIIPTRNVVSYLEECLLSIKQQKILDPDVTFDIWIGVDNCEQTLSYLRERIIDFPAAKAFYFNEHLGPYIIRNTLATLCDADYIVFFDSDDIMTDGFLQSLIAPLKSNDIVQFGLNDFIEVKDRDGLSQKVFDRQAIKRFEKNVIKQNAALINGKRSLLKKFLSVKESKYLNSERYYKFITGIFKQRKSGVFAIKKSTFIKLNGFKAWKVQADVEFVMRAGLIKDYKVTHPKQICFLRRIHDHNITSSYKFGMNSQLRKEYQKKSKTSIYKTEPIVISDNYSEIFNVLMQNS